MSSYFSIKKKIIEKTEKMQLSLLFVRLLNYVFFENERDARIDEYEAAQIFNATVITTSTIQNEKRRRATRTQEKSNHYHVVKWI